MNISNETKVGALTAVAITLLILGFNFLKGRTVFKTGNYLYAKFSNTKKIMVSNPVYINGYQVGIVNDVENEDENLQSIIVAIKLKTSYNIPVNSVAMIDENPLGAESVDIKLGNGKQYLKSGDSLQTENALGLMDEISNKFTPITDQLKKTMNSLDQVLQNINSVFDPNTKNNIQQSVANINKVTESLTHSSQSIQAMLDKQDGTIAQSVSNMNSFTKNLADNNTKISNTLSNVEQTTNNLSKADVEGAVARLKTSAEKLNTLLDKINSKESSLGLLVNDKGLYNQLINTVKSTNTLVDDLRMHPKRYVNISVFGKKDKKGPLMAPLNDSTAQHK